MLKWGKKPQFGISHQPVNKMGVQCQMETVLTLIKLQMVGVQNNVISHVSLPRWLDIITHHSMSFGLNHITY